MASTYIGLLLITYFFTKVFCNLLISSIPIGRGDVTVLKCPNGEISLIDSGNTRLPYVQGSSVNHSSYKQFVETHNMNIKHIILMQPNTVTPHVAQGTNLNDYYVYICGNQSDYIESSEDFLAKAERIYGFTHIGGKRPDSCGLKKKGLFRQCQYYDTQSNTVDGPGATTVICDDEFAITVVTSIVAQGSENSFDMALKITPHPKYREISFQENNLTAPRTIPSMLVLGGSTNKNFYHHLMEADQFYVKGSMENPTQSLSSTVLWRSGLKSDVFSLSTSIDNAISNEFVKTVSPKMAVINADNQQYGNNYPSCEVMKKISNAMRRKVKQKKIQCYTKDGKFQNVNVYDSLVTRSKYTRRQQVFYTTIFGMSSTDITYYQQKVTLGIPNDGQLENMDNKLYTEPLIVQQ